MKTYDPADRIHYVHLPHDRAPAAPAAPAAPPPPARDECDRLSAGYANASLRHALGRPRTADARPVLVVLAGGSTAADGLAPPAPALRLAR